MRRMWAAHHAGGTVRVKVSVTVRVKARLGPVDRQLELGSVLGSGLGLGLGSGLVFGLGLWPCARLGPVRVKVNVRAKVSVGIGVRVKVRVGG